MKKEDLTRQAVILGALLHDIGKFVQRAQKNPKEKDHPHWGMEWFQRKDGLRKRPRLASVFCEQELVIIDSAILSHHDGVKYISLADAISAGMKRISLEDEEEGDPFTDRLISIFSRISISNKSKDDKY
ncbi:MAG: HD domain-containing protein, partial [Candidatus Omnitrophica bacterium]|nr:HD domain-containing protein [Candidatus Omnitrophota bacterium]